MSDNESELVDRIGQTWRALRHELVWLIVERRVLVAGDSTSLHWRAVELTGDASARSLWLSEITLTLSEELGPALSAWERVQ